MENLLTKLGGRKFFLVMLVFYSSSILMYYGKVTNVAYMSLSQMLLLSYALGNVSQTFILNKLDDGTVQQIDLFGGRKFTLVVLMYFNMIAFVWFNHITSAMYVEFTQWLVGVYILGNISSKAVENGLSVTIGKK